MPGRLHRDFRYGNLAENLGVLLLKGIAAVADVPRPEDVGLDAIATLLRLDNDDNHYAEDTFIVQLKSASTRLLKYTGHELKWLIDQPLPMFVGLVSLDESKISLFSTIHVKQAALALHAEWVNVKFGPSSLPAVLEGQRWLPWRGEDEKHQGNGCGATVWLGEPLLEWTLKDIVCEKWNRQTYGVLKRFLNIARCEINLLGLGHCSVLNWATNDSESISSQFGMMKGSHGGIDSVAQQAAPFLQSLSLCAMKSEPIMKALVALSRALREVGTEIDPDDFLKKI